MTILLFVLTCISLGVMAFELTAYIGILSIILWVVFSISNVVMIICFGLVIVGFRIINKLKLENGYDQKLTPAAFTKKSFGELFIMILLTIVMSWICWQLMMPWLFAMVIVHLALVVVWFFVILFLLGSGMIKQKEDE